MPPSADFPDPLYLPGIEQFELQLEEVRDDPERDRIDVFEFAPDELHRAAVSGGTHDIWLPDAAPDPILVEVAGRAEITLVDY